MRKLLNVLYVTSEDAYLRLDGENIVIKKNDCEAGRFPLHTLEGIVSFSYLGASPALMGACAERGISFSLCTPNGRFLARICGRSKGNVLLRRTQYRMADDLDQCCLIARNMIYAKIHNSRWSIDRTLRDHSLRVDADRLGNIAGHLRSAMQSSLSAPDLESLRGYEGEAASLYFGVFDEMILNAKETFFFRNRSRRPPLDNVNALLSFAYSLLENECASALEVVGLDSYVGFMHRDRPGRESLALDIMEELRPYFADRFVLTLVNTSVINGKDFEKRENGAVFLTDEGRKKFLSAWQERKQDIITHPFTKEKMPRGLVPFMQAQLLARYLRDDIDGYPPFLWK